MYYGTISVGHNLLSSDQWYYKGKFKYKICLSIKVSDFLQLPKIYSWQSAFKKRLQVIRHPARKSREPQAADYFLYSNPLPNWVLSCPCPYPSVQFVANVFFKNPKVITVTYSSRLMCWLRWNLVQKLVGGRFKDRPPEDWSADVFKRFRPHVTWPDLEFVATGGRVKFLSAL